MKQVILLSVLALALVCLAAMPAPAQTPTPTPDPFVTQISSSAADTFARDISADGRFVVIESNGDIASVPPGQTADTKSPNNADGNREIFLYDAAQRRIFQITNTRSVITDATKTGSDRFAQANIAVEISNNRPTISRDGRWIAFTSNAPTPFSFAGDTADAATVNALKADGNQEVFIYRVPAAPAASLTSGDLPAYTELRANAFTRVTDTPASRAPIAGSANLAPSVADDNRDVQLNDDGSRLVFVSTRDFATTANGLRNGDFSPEVFVYNNTSPATLVQVTRTSLDQNLFVFSDNPNISGNATGNSTIAFISNATDLRFTAATDAASNIASANADGNAEIFVATYNGATVTSMRQVTRTRRQVNADLVNVLSPGRRMSRSGNLLAFESVAADPKADTASTNAAVLAMFVYNISADTFTQAGPRAASDEAGDVLRFPTFTGDETRLLFASSLNLKTDGTRVAAGDTSGLNPNRYKQIFSSNIPTPGNTSITVSRLTNATNGAAVGSFAPLLLEPLPSQTQERIAFSLASTEFGTGNPDGAHEAYYLIVPPAPAASDTSLALQFLTGASRREVVTPTASPTPTPSPAPLTGLAPGEIAIVRVTAADQTLAPSEKRACAPGVPCDAASESMHRPPLPVELNGVSVSVNGAAAGLYFVGPSEIQFVVPIGLTAQTGAATYPVVINVRSGATVRTVRTTLQVVAAQPDVFSTANGPGGRAVITNVTNPLLSTGTSEPFAVTTTYINSSGQSVTEATRLRVVLTGVRGVTRANITVRLVKSDGTNVDIVGDATTTSPVPTDPQATDMPGVFTLDFRLPASLAGAGDVSIVILVNQSGASFTSRPADTAPKFRIS